MNFELYLAMAVVILGASGTYLLLPHNHGASRPRTTHAIGAGLAGLALLLFAYFWSAPAPWLSGLFFYAFSFGSVACAVLTVTSRNPVHSALWFAAVVLSTAGLFLQAGASFLAAGTVIVYAGAIIVTFLFVIMLAQSEGHAPYDRAARMPFRATFTCYMLLLGVMWSLFQIPVNSDTLFGTAGFGLVPDPRLLRPAEIAAQSGPQWVDVSEVVARSVRSTARLTDEKGLVKLHVAGLGETLYTDHLVVVELTGALLFVALIGALAIAAPKPPTRWNGETRGSTTVTPSTSNPTTVNA